MHSDAIRVAEQALLSVQLQAAVGPVETTEGQLFDNQRPTATQWVARMSPEARQALLTLVEPRLRRIRKGFRCYASDDDQQRVDWSEALGHLVAAWIDQDPNTAIPAVLEQLPHPEGRSSLLYGIQLSSGHGPLRPEWVQPVLEVARDDGPIDRATGRPLWTLLERIGRDALPELYRLAHRFQASVPEWEEGVMQSVLRLESN